MYYGHCFVAIYKDDTSGRLSLALCIMAVASWQYERMTLLEDVCGPLYMKHRVGLGGAQSCRSFWKIHIGSILSQMYHMHAAWLKMKQFSEPLPEDTQVWVGGVPSDLFERVFLDQLKAYGITPGLTRFPPNPDPQKEIHIMLWTTHVAYIIFVLITAQVNLNISCVHIMFGMNKHNLNISYVQILFGLSTIWTYQLSKYCLIWTHHMFRSCLVWTWYGHIGCPSSAWSERIIYVQILSDMNMIWTYHMFK